MNPTEWRTLLLDPDGELCLRYRSAGAIGPEGAVDLTLWSDGRTRLTHDGDGQRQAWEGQASVAMVARLTSALLDAGFPGVAPLSPEVQPDWSLAEVSVEAPGYTQACLIHRASSNGDEFLEDVLLVFHSMISQASDGSLGAWPDALAPVVWDVKRV